MKVLVVDVGGSHVKVRSNGRSQPAVVDTGPTFGPADLVESVKSLTRDLEYDVVSIGFPSPVSNGKLVHEPVNLGGGWLGFDFAGAFGKPVRLINDAAMQALGSYQGGRMLFLGLGTGLGAALVIDGVLQPLELGHLPYLKRRTYEEYVGVAGRNRMGRKKWERHVHTVVALFAAAFQVDYIVLGGGNSKDLKVLPESARLGDNSNAFIGGERLWK